jgi:hypothetical protein
MGIDAAYELAERSYLPRRSQFVADLNNEVRQRIAELASKGIHGGPTVQYVVQAGSENMIARCAAAADELQRACNSKHIVFYPGLLDDLNTGFDLLTESDAASATNNIAAAISYLPNLVAVKAAVAQAMLQARLQGAATAKADLAHFAANLEYEAASAASAAPTARNTAPSKLSRALLLRRIERVLKWAGLIGGAIGAGVAIDRVATALLGEVHKAPQSSVSPIPATSSALGDTKAR